MSTMEINNDFINAVLPLDFDVSRFEGKKLLVMGSGPSTLDVNWEVLDYDYIFTCNLFYKCDKLSNKTVQFVSLINRMFDIAPFIDQQLQDRIDRDKTFIGVEPKHTAHKYDTNNFQKFLTKYQNQCVFFDTKFQNRAGAAPRLAIFAAALKPKTIYVVGCDGHGNNSAPNAFEKNLFGIRDHHARHVSNDSHIQFAKYFHELCTKLNIEHYNLGEGHFHNAATEVSSKLYPLTDEIKAKMNENN